MTMIWNCTLQKMCPDIKQFFSLSKFPLELSAPCSTSRSAFLSMEAKKKKKNVIANSNMSVSLSQVSLSETEER